MILKNLFLRGCRDDDQFVTGVYIILSSFIITVLGTWTCCLYDLTSAPMFTFAILFNFSGFLLVIRCCCLENQVKLGSLDKKTGQKLDKGSNRTLTNIRNGLHKDQQKLDILIDKIDKLHNTLLFVNSVKDSEKEVKKLISEIKLDKVIKGE